MSTWQTRKNGCFQHSFGSTSSGCGHPRHGHTPLDELVDQVPECAYEGDRREAAAAMLAAQSTVSPNEGQPISLFNFRDALTVSRTLSLVGNEPEIVCLVEQRECTSAPCVIVLLGESSGQDVAP